MKVLAHVIMSGFCKLDHIYIYTYSYIASIRITAVCFSELLRLCAYDVKFNSYREEHIMVE